MIFLRIKSDCLAARRPLRAGEVLPLDELPQRDRQILIGAGLAETIERYEVPDPKPTVADPAPANIDPKPAKKAKAKK